MRKFDLAALELVDEDHISLTLIRETVMPDDSLISKLETYTISRSLLPSSLISGLNDFVDTVLDDYKRGLLELPGIDLDPPVDDDDSDSIGLK